MEDMVILYGFSLTSLPSSGAYIDARGGQFNGTALHMAAEGGHSHTVQLLIAETADVSIQDKQTRLPQLLSRDEVSHICVCASAGVLAYACVWVAWLVMICCKKDLNSCDLFRQLRLTSLLLHSLDMLPQHTGTPGLNTGACTNQCTQLLLLVDSDRACTDYALRSAQATRKAFSSPFVKTMCHAMSCTAEGPGVQPKPRASDNCMFIIQPRDRYGVPLKDPFGLLNFTVDVQDPVSLNIVPAKVVPNPRIGSSVCYFDGSKSGIFLVHVYMEDFRNEGELGPGERTAIAGSPFRYAIRGLILINLSLYPCLSRLLSCHFSVLFDSSSMDQSLLKYSPRLPC